MLDTIIVDDEAIARTALVRLCNDYKDLNVVGVCSSGNEALEIFKSQEVDLMFLDIEMPNLSGLELLDQLSYSPQVIVSSSKKSYAFDAFEYDVTDYLVKPIKKSRFRNSIEKVKQRVTALQDLRDISSSSEIYIKSEGKYIRLEYSAINYFENVGDYVKVCTGQNTYVIHSTLKSISKKLGYRRLIKVHRSYIVNLDKVTDIKGNSLVIGKKVIPVSRANRNMLIESLNIL